MKGSFEAYRLEWPVSIYRWEKVFLGERLPAKMPGVLKETRWALVDVGQTAEPRRYQPLRLPALFREFASLETKDREAIERFANQYGFLGLPRMAHTEGHQEILIAEGWQDWVNEINVLRLAVETWEMVRKKDLEGLKKHFCYKKDEKNQGNWTFDSAPGRPLEEEGFSHRVRLPLEFDNPADYFGPAWHMVRKWINDGMVSRVSPLLYPNRLKGGEALVMAPSGLIGALWLQLARGIADERDYRPCKQCGRWFEISSDARTAGRLFCGNTCKVRDFRYRQARAREMASQGMDPKAIGKELNTDVKSIRQWIKKRG